MTATSLAETPATTPKIRKERSGAPPLTPEGQALAEMAIAEADRIAKRYARMFPEHADELSSSAHLGVVRAAAKFAADDVWKRWCRIHITSELRDFLRSLGRRCDKPTSQESLEAIEDEESDPARLIDAADSFSHMTRSLTPRQREVVNLVYVHGMTPAEAGRSLGLARAEGCKIHQRAIRSLRDTLKVA